MASLKFACVVAVICMVVVITAPMTNAITCGEVARSLSPCINYLRSRRGGSPEAECCRGVTSLNRAASNTADRRTACNCLKSVAASISGLNANNAASLPGRCRVRVPYRISTSTNCNRYVILTTHSICFPFFTHFHSVTHHNFTKYLMLYTL
ncbi:Non-specific lipid-transfer protein 1 [Glycine soja]|uniref:Non-specific lipid-transfer protein n=1 Tax=Glycine soja TaxID=3848 RepID=A0A0B2SKN4_GLYSO|nr:Non-specific lipid-transfer protein 1 [Glycine soja]